MKSWIKVKDLAGGMLLESILHEVESLLTEEGEAHELAAPQACRVV